MLFIGNLMLSMVINLAKKSKIIPSILFMVLVPIMRSKAGLYEVSSYSTISGCMLTVLPLLYSKNLTWRLPFPFLWKFPFDVDHDFGTWPCQVGIAFGCSFLWDKKSPLDPL